MTSGSAPDLSAAFLRAAQTLNIDQTTALVARRLNAAGIRTVLLKGPSLARWLYDDAADRSYVDSDLLVAPSELMLAIEVLKGLGLEPLLGRAGRWEQDGHSVVLRSPPDDASPLAEVDLHFSLPGADAPAGGVWQVLAAESVRLRVAGYDVEALSEAACAVVVVLHAARNGMGIAQSTEDLERLLERLPPEHWPHVYDLAARIDALPAVARGLQLVPRGTAIARELGLSGVRSVEMELRSHQAPPLAYGLHRLASSSDWRDRIRMVAGELWPTDAFLRLWAEREERPARGRIGRRLDRLGYLVRETAPAVQAFVRARRSSLRRRGDA